MRASTSSDCVFCRIAGGEIPARIVHEDDELLAFEDLNPQAPAHLLVIPRAHIASVGHLESGDAALAGRLLLAAGEVARRCGIEAAGYRIVVNTGSDGGQTVEHIHLHVLGGRRFLWPPG